MILPSFDLNSDLKGQIEIFSFVLVYFARNFMCASPVTAVKQVASLLQKRLHVPQSWTKFFQILVYLYYLGLCIKIK